jgi:hypothetical protein
MKEVTMASARKTRRTSVVRLLPRSGTEHPRQPTEASALGSETSSSRQLPLEVAATRDGLSFEARRRGFTSARAVKAEFLRQQQDWWAGKRFYCPFCDVYFDRPARAAEHLTARQHPVLRWDEVGE